MYVCDVWELPVGVLVLVSSVLCIIHYIHVWVLVHLCEMYDELQSDRTELMQINREKVRLRLLRHRDDLNRGLTALNAVAEAFAPAGHSLISELSIRAQELSYAD